MQPELANPSPSWSSNLPFQAADVCSRWELSSAAWTGKFESQLEPESVISGCRFRSQTGPLICSLHWQIGVPVGTRICELRLQISVSDETSNLQPRLANPSPNWSQNLRIHAADFGFGREFESAAWTREFESHWEPFLCKSRVPSGPEPPNLLPERMFDRKLQLGRILK